MNTAEKSLFLPALLLALAVVGALGLQTFQYAAERQMLQQRTVASQPQMAAAQQLRASLDGLALATDKLAREGNPNARALVEELRKRGMNIDPSKAAAKP
ncbi:MAG: hypothetical protein V4463_20660 [Pseudomonadota bacterium]